MRTINDANDVIRENVTGNARFATRDEIDQSFEKLSNADLLRLKNAARIFCYFNGIPGFEQDLFQETITRVYQRDRRWAPDSGDPLYKCLIGAMRSIAWAWAKKCHVANKTTGEPQTRLVTTVAGAEGDLDILDTLPARDLCVADEYDGARTAEKIMRLFAGDPEAVKVIEGRMLGFKGVEIQKLHRFSETQYETIYRRVVRRVERFLRT